MTAYPRILIAAGASGSGKTLVTCGLLQALRMRGLRAAAFKCGPDYIDPMFHEKMLHTRSRNLDTFFTEEETTRYLFMKHAKDADISVMEGVMGYYDGLGGTSEKAGAYDLARVTDTPAVLIVNARGMSLSILAYIRGFLTYRPDSRIRGVILNQISASLYAKLGQRIEEELHIPVFGYVPKADDCVIDSRHLGLVTPDEIPDLEERMKKLAGMLEKTLNIDALLALAKSADPLPGEKGEETPVPPGLLELLQGERCARLRKEAPVIAVARDEAFCFLYEDNLQLLRELGADTMEFSPLWDSEIPKEADGLLLYGGYPELYARRLSENVSMRHNIYRRITDGMPCMAECGGFLYLHETMEDMEGRAWPMAAVIRAAARRTQKLTRFGYIELTEKEKDGAVLRGHEFHYFDSTDNGSYYLARKPLQGGEWRCIHRTDHLLAGFPHLYYYSNPLFALEFAEQCAAYKTRK